MASRSDAVQVGRPRASSATRSRAAESELRLGHPAVLIGLTACALVVVGLVMILSASSVSSFATYGSSFWFFKKQLLWVAMGAVGLLVASRFDYRKLAGAGYLAYALAVLLLIVVLVPGVGVSVGGSARWIAIGPIQFQPSEMAKLALVLFGAEVFARKKESTFGDFSHAMLPMIPAIAVLGLLIMMQPDLGTTLIIGNIGMSLLFVAGARLRHLVPVGLAGATVALAAAFSADYRRARILAFVDPWADPLNTGYQTIQSLIALGSGGWFGVGLGASRQKWMYIPNAHTDFIYAILGEEMGLLGTLSVLALFAFLTYMGVRTARRAPDRFGMLLAAGITVWISLQALINIGAVTASLPITGVPLPLVSFGGSSLVITLIAVGMLANIALQGERAAARRRPRAPVASSRRGRTA
nr:putative lipid II flippase FtsW [Actinomycetota bacterium]